MLLSVWQRIPIVIRAIVVGALAAISGTVPWALMVAANTKYLPEVPWSVLPAAIYLWYWWKYMSGKGWPQSTSESRRKSLRANRVTSDVWSGAIGVGMMGTITFLLFMGVFNRLVRLPTQSAAEELGSAPLFTTLLWLLMGSTVAGVVEEGSFRGYMQGPIERRHGPLIAILITGIFFGFAHATHGYFSVVLLPYFLIIAAMYGGLAWATNSILPGLVMHAGLDVIGGLQLLATGQSEWMGSLKPLVWETGGDVFFWLNLVALIGFGTATVWAYIGLAKSSRNSTLTASTL